MMLVNRDRANQIMDKYGLDGLVAAFPENIYYLSNYWGPMFLMSRNYTLFAFLPRDPNAPAALIMPGTGVYHLEHCPTWMPNVATYITRIKPGKPIPPRDFEFTTEDVEEDIGDRIVTEDSVKGQPLTPYPIREGAPMLPRDQQLLNRYAMHSDNPSISATRALAGALRTAGVTRGKIGFDDPRVLGWLQAVGLEDLSGVDALNIFKEIRIIKTPAEIELLRKASVMSENALNKVIDALEPGLPLDELPRIHAMAMAEQGGNSEFIIANIRGLATGVVEPNEIMKLDSVGSYKQYRGDVGRTVICGTPTDEMIKRNEIVGRAMEIAYENIRPGKTFKEIVDITLKAVHDMGFPGFVIAAPHSVGLEHTDHPVSVGPELPGHHPLVFEENMVFTLDMPYHEFGWGTMHVEDMMLVTKDGCESLTSRDTSLRIKPL